MTEKDYYSPLKVEYETKYGDAPRKDVLQLIKSNPGRILEIGCGTGATGITVKEMFSEAEYWGIEVDEKAVSIASKRLDKALSANIENDNLEKEGVEKESFDLVICADVLEHLYDPWKTLAILKEYLKAGGKIIASIPNSQNIHLIQQLINGNWSYTNHGLLDATHIRFFTLTEIDKLFHGTGYKIINYLSVLQESVPEEGWPRDIEFDKFSLKKVSKDDFARFVTFQYLVLAQKNT